MRSLCRTLTHRIVDRLSGHRIRLSTLAAGAGDFLLADHNPRLGLGDNLLDFRRALLPLLLLVPVRIALPDHHLRFAEQWPLPSLRVHQRQRHFRHPQRIARPRPGKDDVLHLAAAQAFGALLAEHPAHRVEDVRLAAPVRSHHHRHSLAGQVDFGAVTKGLKAQDLNLLQFEHGGLNHS